jgi:hypothetical protein
MRCEECLSVLDQYVEDELDEVTAKSVGTHMTDCRECAGAHEALCREQEIYARYLVDVEPPPHLWANLRSELNKDKAIRESRPRLQRWLALVFGDLSLTPQIATALVLITIGLAIGIILWRRTLDAPNHEVQNLTPGVQSSSEGDRAGADRDADKTDRRSADEYERKIRPPSPESAKKGRQIQTSAANRAGRRMIERTPAAPTVKQVALQAEQQYLSAIEILSRDIERRRAFISPALLSQLGTALTDVDRNIAATRRAAREQPIDPVAVQYLAMAYEKKVELLREVTSR